VPGPATFVLFDIGTLAVLGGRRLIATDRKNSKEIFQKKFFLTVSRWLQ
jgi:hypothetical protein